MIQVPNIDINNPIFQTKRGDVLDITKPKSKLYYNTSKYIVQDPTVLLKWEQEIGLIKDQSKKVLILYGRQQKYETPRILF